MKVTHRKDEMLSQTLSSYFIDSNLLSNLDTKDPVYSVSESPHQLAAIMFTDIAGYSLLMGKDEEGAFDLLEQNRALQKPIVEAFGGTYLKEIGDGILVSFPSASDAVYCAGAIHEAAQSLSSLSLRIGIHIGDVVFKEKDVFGDGVNIASRIQELAKPGQTLITDSVYRNIVNKKGIDAQFISEEHLKNISTSIKIYETRVDAATIAKSRATIEDSHAASSKIDFRKLILILVACSVVIISFGYWLLRQEPIIQNSLSPVVSIGKSLVVLPFLNLSNDPTQEYFSDGITEEIINAVVQYQDLKVIGRTSAFAYKDRNIDLKLIGQQLNVENILEGSIRRDGNKIRVTAQLINANDGYHLWSEQYDRELDDILEIQGEISEKIADKLQATLLRGSTKAMQVHSLEAYDAVLQGNFQMAKPNPEIAQAIEFYSKAIELDPNYPTAYTQLGWGHLHQAWQNPVGAESALRKARQTFRSALYLNPNEPRAQLGLAWVDLGQWQWASAIKHFETAKALNATGLGVFEAWYLALIEADYNGSKQIMSKMIEKDPLDQEYLETLGQINLMAGNYEEATAAFINVLKIDPESGKGFMGLGWSYLQAGNLQEAIVNFSRSKDLSESKNLPEIELALTLTRSDDDLVQILDSIQNHHSSLVDPLILAKLLVLRGEEEGSISWLEKAFEQKSIELVGLRGAKIWDPLRLDVRFQTLINQINYPKESMPSPN